MFAVHDVGGAPVESRAQLQHVEKRFGFVPNLLGLMAESPAAIEGYVAATAAFEKSDFTPLERQVVLLSASLANGCEYCVAAHSTAVERSGAPEGVLDALRNGTKLGNERLEALRDLTRALVEKRGWVSPGDVERCLSAGFSERHVLEVLLGVALKTLSTYTSHIAHPPVDEAFRSYASIEKPNEDVAGPSCCAA